MTFKNHTRKLTILAQDPSVRINGRVAFTQVEIPAEVLSDGPVGYRVRVVDFDASANVLYQPLAFGRDEKAQTADPYLADATLPLAAWRRWEAATLADPRFHAQHVYAVVMRTLARFEFALGRRVCWGFGGHQLHVAPHAFSEANAFYSKEDRALFFGYFPSARTGKTVFTCLAHDIVAHETTHAVLDGLRNSFTNPSTPDQAAFHEGFADVVALLSVFSLKDVVAAVLFDGHRPGPKSGTIRLVSKKAVSRKAIEDSLLLGIGKQFGAEMEGARADALRRSVRLRPDRNLLASEAYQEEHDRGEVFVAAVMHAFLTMWVQRIAALGTFDGDKYNLDLVIEEGAKAADNLLTMAIRALDYCPPVDLTFGDYLASLLTVDAETVPDDTRYSYRNIVRDSFSAFGIDPPAVGTDGVTGQWREFDANDRITYNRTHFASMLNDKEEVFRFVWENRDALSLDDRWYTRIESVRPSVRHSPDGFLVRETVCEYVQVMRIFGAEVGAVLDIKRPDGMPTTQPITAYGGGTLVFDEYGRIKYHVTKPLEDSSRQSARLDYLWRTGQLDAPAEARSRFADIHRRRVS